MSNPYSLPSWLAHSPGDLQIQKTAGNSEITSAIHADSAGTLELAALLSPAAGRRLEEMAARARALTLRQFGRTISLYSPLYLSNYCSSGCAYCGFAADRPVPRRRLEPEQINIELAALKAQGLESVLLLTGEETAQADFTYLLAAVRQAAAQIHNVTVESFAMTADQYRQLADAGCTESQSIRKHMIQPSTQNCIAGALSRISCSGLAHRNAPCRRACARRDSECCSGSVIRSMMHSPCSGTRFTCVKNAGRAE
jgi:hypothetical protein